jgi:hypothetical protein
VISNIIKRKVKIFFLCSVSLGDQNLWMWSSFLNDIIWLFVYLNGDADEGFDCVSSVLHQGYVSFFLFSPNLAAVLPLFYPLQPPQTLATLFFQETLATHNLSSHLPLWFLLLAVRFSINGLVGGRRKREGVQGDLVFLLVFVTQFRWIRCGV